MMKKMYNKIDALKYLSETGPDNINEWTEAGMYHSLCKVIHSEEQTFTKEHLDTLLVEASKY